MLQAEECLWNVASSSAYGMLQAVECLWNVASRRVLMECNLASSRVLMECCKH